jgi:hypothetical protein
MRWPPGRPKRTTRPLRDLQTLLPFPATGRQRNQGGAKVGHPIHQDRPVPLDMVGQQHQRRTPGELDRGDPSPHRLDSKHHPAAQDLAEVPKVPSNIPARRVHEIELLERCGLVSHGREDRSARPSVGTQPPWTKSNGAAGSSGTPSDRISELRRRECAPALKVLKTRRFWRRPPSRSRRCTQSGSPLERMVLGRRRRTAEDRQVGLVSSCHGRESHRPTPSGPTQPRRPGSPCRTAAVGCLVGFKYGCSGQRRQGRASRGEPP